MTQELSTEFAELYESHYPRVRRQVLKMVREPDLAEDLAQEAFLRSWRAFPRWERRCKFATWITRIAINVVSEHFRRGKHRRALPLDADGCRIDVGRDSSADVAAAIHEAIGELTPAEISNIILHHVQGFTHEEIAEKLGSTVGSSKSHVVRAVHRLRKVLWVEQQRTFVEVSKGDRAA